MSNKDLGPARKAMNTYRREIDDSGAPIRDLLGDLFHLCLAEGFNPLKEKDRAWNYFISERGRKEAR